MSFIRALLKLVMGHFRLWWDDFQWPRNISDWRSAHHSAETLWSKLGPVLRKNGLESWKHVGLLALARPDNPLDNGYMRSGRLCSTTPVERYQIENWTYTTPLLRAVRSKGGVDFVCKVLVVGDDGKTGLHALRQALSGWSMFQAENHILPLLREIHVDTIVIGVFPMGSSASLHDFVRRGGLAEHSSLGDLLHALAQALEALMFLHDKRVAHRDAFLNNFMVEWMPHSLEGTRRPLAAHPRVWLFDFETAIAFPPAIAPKDCLCSGRPFPDIPTQNYTRPIPGALLEGEEYNALELDLWQFSAYVRPLKCANSRVDDVLGKMGDALNAAEELSRVQDVLGELSPNELRVPYEKICFDRSE